jgi:hypothetical protein
VRITRRCKKESLEPETQSEAGGALPNRQAFTDESGQLEAATAIETSTSIGRARTIGGLALAGQLK